MIKRGLYCSTLILLFCSFTSCEHSKTISPASRADVQDSTFQAAMAQYLDWVMENQFYFHAYKDSLRTMEEAHKWIDQIDPMAVELSDQFSEYSPDLFLETSNWQYISVYGVLDTNYRFVSIGTLPQFDTADSTLMGVKIRINPDSTVTVDPYPPLHGYGKPIIPD